MDLHATANGVPYIDQYLGVWSMYPPALQSFKTLAEQININLHMSNNPQAITAVSRSGDISEATNRDGIATIELHGSLLKHASSFSANTSTVAARRMVRAAKDDPDVLGVMVHLDTPGGTVAGTDDLAADIAALSAAKPTMAYIEDLGASAGYWLASQTGTVYSNSTAVVGSIGVLSVVYDLSRAAEAENITVHVIKAGEMKGAGVPGTEITEEQLAEWQKLVDAFYNDFIGAVAAGRNIPSARAAELADGRVHIGQVAADLGLTDGVRSLDEAYQELVAQTGRSRGRDRMSQADDKTADVVAQAATAAELKNALPNADQGFLFEQIEKGATLAAAREAFADERERQLAEREAAIEKAEHESQKEAKAKPAGLKPLEDSAASEDNVTFESLIADVMEAKGIDRRAASRMVAKSHKQLHEAYLDGCPDGRG